MSEIQQRSAEWFALRWGRITGSEFQLAAGSPATQKRLAKRKRYELANPVEIPDEINVPSLSWGRVNEPKALAQYEMLHGDLTYPAFTVHPKYDWIGFSPDGIGDRKGVEVKSPYDGSVHQLTLMLGMPPVHQSQVQGGMWVYDFGEWDFVSFDPRISPPDDLYIQPISRDQGYISNLERCLLKVWDMVNSDKDLDVEDDFIPKLF